MLLQFRWLSLILLNPSIHIKLLPVPPKKLHAPQGPPPSQIKSGGQHVNCKTPLWLIFFSLQMEQMHGVSHKCHLMWILRLLLSRNFSIHMVSHFFVGSLLSPNFFLQTEHLHGFVPHEPRNISQSIQKCDLLLHWPVLKSHQSNMREFCWGTPMSCVFVPENWQKTTKNLSCMLALLGPNVKFPN